MRAWLGGVVRSGDLRKYGITRRQLRHWQTTGLLSPERSSGRQAIYSTADIRRARLIQACRDSGLRDQQLERTVSRIAQLIESMVVEMVGFGAQSYRTR